MNRYRHLKEKREDILQIAQSHGARNIRIFGSASREEDTMDSDLDLLIDLEPGRSLLDHISLIQDLEELLGCRVDVVTEKSLHWFIRDRILQEAIPL